jgi:uncharacterized protein
MTVQLRAHHLLCMLTFAGKGYGQEFVANFEQVVDRIAGGNETIEIVDGPDDVCRPLLGEADCHCRNASVALRDRQAAEAISGLLQRPIEAGTQLRLDDELLGTLRKAFAQGTIRQACGGCQWKPVCDGIAQEGFSGTRLKRQK